MPDPPAPVVAVSPWWMIAHALILGAAIVFVQLSGFLVTPRPPAPPPVVGPVEPPATQPPAPPPGPINPVPEARAAARIDAPGTVRTILVGDHAIRVRLGEDGVWVVVPAAESKDAKTNE